MVTASEKLAKRQCMTRSELIRAALRQFLEEHAALEAIGTYERERRSGGLKTLKSLTSFLK